MVAVGEWLMEAEAVADGVSLMDAELDLDDDNDVDPLWESEREGVAEVDAVALREMEAVGEAVVDGVRLTDTEPDVEIVAEDDAVRDGVTLVEGLVDGGTQNPTLTWAPA
jgi:hypothetical protein